MRKLVAAAVIAATAATSACSRNRAEDGGPTVSRNFQVGAFEEVVAGGPFDVTVRTGAAPSVSATGNQKLIDRLTVEVKDGKLVIGTEKRDGWRWGSHGGKATVTITVPSLRAATLAGAGDMSIDKVQGDRFEGSIAGAGDLKVASVNVANLKIAIAGAGDARLGSGKAAQADYALAGAGDVDAKGLVSENIKVSIVGAGSVSAQATKTADVSIMGAGDVELAGGAKCSVHKMGAGDVRCS